MKVGTASGTGRYHIQAEINMVPLIDVALVLLIIFMVISPMLVHTQMKVNVPKVTSTPEQSADTALKVNIDATGNMEFQGHRVSRAALREEMGALLLDPNHKAALYIEADRGVPFEQVVYVMDVAKQLKIEKLGVAVQQELGR